MSQPRTDVVNELVVAAMEGMERVPDYSVAELMSASFTMCMRLIRVTTTNDPTQATALRSAVHALLMACTSGRAN